MRPHALSRTRQDKAQDAVLTFYQHPRPETVTAEMLVRWTGCTVAAAEAVVKGRLANGL